MAERAARPMLKIDDLHVHYGESHAIQGVSLTPGKGRAVGGRPQRHGQDDALQHDHRTEAARSGSIRVDGREVSTLEPHEIHNLGVGYVPQGRRIWPSLSVDEHLRLAAGTRRDAAWTVERVYQTFPRLAERRGNGGSQLSGGEQQMLAISRALLSTRSCWSWTSPPRASRRSSSARPGTGRTSRRRHHSPPGVPFAAVFTTPSVSLHP